MTSPADSTAAVVAQQDVIVIDDLRVPAHIGVLESEKGRTQTIRFDIEIRTVPGYSSIVRSSGRYVSYADTVEFIEDKAASGNHIELVEEWAEAVADFVLQNDLADLVTVKLTKLDIFDRAAGVGIRIVRTRK